MSALVAEHEGRDLALLPTVGLGGLDSGAFDGWLSRILVQGSRVAAND